MHEKRTGKKECTAADALLYLEDRGALSPSLDSKFISCRNCGLERDMGRALTRTGIKYVTRRRCRGRSPWLKSRGREDCELFPAGMLKGASNVYFPVTRSSITIPPFSDELSREVLSQQSTLKKLSTMPPGNFRQTLEVLFDVKTEDNPAGKYSVDQVLEKYRLVSSAPSEGGWNIFELEFAQLNAGLQVDDEEFKMRPAPGPGRFGAYVDRVAQVEKLRQIVSITGFTRMQPPGGPEDGGKIVPISSEPPEWLPAAENRGEGIFLSLRPEKLRSWENLPGTVARVREVAGPTGSPAARTPEAKAADARYVLLHTLSHMLIHSLSDLAGYSASSMRERIYSSESMAGILIFTSSPSSDGSLGGLAEQGGSNFDQVLQRAVERSRTLLFRPAVLVPRARRHGGAWSRVPHVHATSGAGVRIHEPIPRQSGRAFHAGWECGGIFYRVMRLDDADLGGIHADLLKVLELPPRALAALSDLLEEGADVNPLNAPDLLGVRGPKIEPLLRLLQGGRLGRDCLLVSLRVSATAARRAAESADECALCWTGPASLDVVERSTDAVVREMIEGAREEILIVGYRITAGGEAAGRLADALRRIGEIIIVIDDDEGRANRSALDSIFRGPQKPRIYVHRKKEGAFYKVHAKNHDRGQEGTAGDIRKPHAPRTSPKLRDGGEDKGQVGRKCLRGDTEDDGQRVF